MMTMKAIADAYAAAPELQPAALPAWRKLAEHCMKQAGLIRRQMTVIEVNTDRPYATATTMFTDIGSGTIRVSRTQCDHPVWSVDENVAFRLCHDVMGHYLGGIEGQIADFSWKGELRAHQWQELTCPKGPALFALYTEVVGQAAYALDRGEFGLQKVAFL